VKLAAQMLVQVHANSEDSSRAHEFATLEQAEVSVRRQLANGEALEAFRKMVIEQGGDVGVVDRMASSPHGPEQCGDIVIVQAIYGLADVPASSVEGSPGFVDGQHGIVWGPACQGLEGCRSLDRFFMRAGGEDSAPDGGANTALDADVASAIARSQKAPHGPVVARVSSLNALEVGRSCVGIGAGRQQMGEELSLGSGILLHKKVGDAMRQGDVLFTLFAQVGGKGGGGKVPRRVITQAGIDAAAARVINAYGFTSGAAEPTPLVRCFIGRDGSVHR
jgi:hypothetical protein